VIAKKIRTEVSVQSDDPQTVMPFHAVRSVVGHDLFRSFAFNPTLIFPKTGNMVVIPNKVCEFGITDMNVHR
jgi:hypothetical protein